MDRQKIESTYRWRKTLIDNFDKIKAAKDSSKKADLSSQGQLNMFDAGMEDVKEIPKLKEYDGAINPIEFVHIETKLLGLPVFWNPLDDLDMYVDLYCTHTSVDLLEMNEDSDSIIILDRVVDIEYRISKNGNKYCKLFLSNLGHDKFLYLFGKQFKELIPKVYRDECYLINIKYRMPTPDFDRESISVLHLKNIKDVDIEEEYTRIYNLCEVSKINESWQIKNKY